MADTRRLILKHEDLFGLFDRYGDIVPVGHQRYRPLLRGHTVSFVLLPPHGGPQAAVPEFERRRGQPRDERRPHQPRHRPEGPHRPGQGLHPYHALAVPVSRTPVSNRSASGISAARRSSSSSRSTLEADFKDIFEIRGMQAEGARQSSCSARSRPDGHRPVLSGAGRHRQDAVHRRRAAARQRARQLVLLPDRAAARGAGRTSSLPSPVRRNGKAACRWGSTRPWPTAARPGDAEPERRRGTHLE